MEAESRLERRELDGVVALFDAAEKSGADPEFCAGRRWMTHMLSGNFEDAWRQSDALRARGAPDPHRFWQGESIRGGRVILRCLHGFGDAVQMLRYIPLLREQVAELVVEVPPRLLEIAPCFEGLRGVEVVTWGENAPTITPDWDVQIEVMELPYMFRTACEELPLACGYLKPSPGGIERAKAAMGSSSRMRVGVVSSAGEWNRGRSIPLDDLLPILEVNGCEFWSLQGGSAAEEWNDLAASRGSGHEPPSNLRDAAECGDGIHTLAAVISQLDLVITVDTLAAHLAGAMGVPAWVMLQREADWRWMTQRTDTPWYPSVRLRRQREAGAWKGLVDELTAELQVLCGTERTKGLILSV